MDALVAADVQGCGVDEVDAHTLVQKSMSFCLLIENMQKLSVMH